MDQLPVFFNLTGRWVAVLGGGVAAARKAELAMRAGARVRVFAEQYCEPYKVKKEDLRSNSIIYIYEKGNGNDHYRNAMNYFYLAAMGSRVISPDGQTRKLASQCIHETVRL